MKKMIDIWKTSINWDRMSRKEKNISLVIGVLAALLLSGVWLAAIPLAYIFMPGSPVHLPDIDE